MHFVRLVLMLSMVDILSNTLITLQNATGRIRNYQLVVGSILLLNFPISYLCLKAGLEPESTYVVAILVGVTCMMARLLFVRKTASLPMSGFMRNVILNVVLVTLCALVLPCVVHVIMPGGWKRFVVVGAVSVMTSAMSIFFVGCNGNERAFIKEKISSVIERFAR